MMLNSWFGLTLLAFEASSVVHLRMSKFAFGGEGALDEAYLMVTEKMDAAMEAFGSILTGSSSKDVIERYRELVAANAERLR
jgi:hypothetical protein